VLEAATLQLFGSCLDIAVDSFASRLEGHKWVAMPAPMFKQQSAQQRAEGSADGGGGGSGGGADPAAAGGQQQPGGPGDAAAAGGGGGGGDDLAPPYGLMEHLPLAVFVNGVLSALNEIRHCTLLPLRRPMAALLQAALERAAGALAHYRATRTLGEAELQLFSAAVQAYGEAVVPYLSACFARLFAGGAGGAGAGGAASAPAPAAGGGGGAVDAAAVAAVLREALDDGGGPPLLPAV
jgi:conserved oligomeric Golgi complex subunit 8